MFNFKNDNTKQNLSAPNNQDLKPILGKILLDKKTLFLSTYQRQNFYIEDFAYMLVICEATSVPSNVGFKISAQVRHSSVTSNTLWASVNFLGQITVQRYVVFVSTVELRTLYIQELPYMNTFCECILKKIGPTHAHFQYNAKKLM